MGLLGAPAAQLAALNLLAGLLLAPALFFECRDLPPTVGALGALAFPALGGLLWRVRRR